MLPSAWLGVPRAWSYITVSTSRACVHIMVWMMAMCGLTRVWSVSFAMQILMPIIECNCIGTILVGVGPVGDRHRLSLDDLKQVKRWASLGNEPFEYREKNTAWEVALVVPSSLFAGLPLCLEPDATLRANFYKCGDDLRVPHFVSWSPIGVERPNFHKPEFFGHLHLQA